MDNKTDNIRDKTEKGVMLDQENLSNRRKKLHRTKIQGRMVYVSHLFYNSPSPTFPFPYDRMYILMYLNNRNSGILLYYVHFIETKIER